MQNYETIKVDEREDGISILTFNRPKRLNAINLQFTEEILDYLKSLENSLDIRVLILIGEGRAFSSGLDLKDFQNVNKRKIPEEYQKYTYLLTDDKIKRSVIVQKLISQMMVQLRKIPQPVIAAVKGSAYGGGLTLALAADIRVAGESAKFCNAFVKIGVSGADCGSSYWLPRLIGFSRAAEFMYTGKVIDAKEADKIGLVSKVVSDSNLLSESLNIANQILNKSPLGIILTKDALNINVDASSLEAAIKLENRTQVVCSNSADILEGVSATLEKREAKYNKW
ncbi:MAG: enoyl-CoA hydratase/isomerase family protein [Promethearchaeota archaeon]